jgi:hypothetical protein
MEAMIASAAGCGDNDAVWLWDSGLGSDLEDGAGGATATTSIDAVGNDFMTDIRSRLSVAVVRTAGLDEIAVASAV